MDPLLWQVISRGPLSEFAKQHRDIVVTSLKSWKRFFTKLLSIVRKKLEKGLPLVAITAAIAPLLGLLGTVTGMIDVFRQITNFANPENSELARGISEALVTTKFGLVTAIPASGNPRFIESQVTGNDF